MVIYLIGPSGVGKSSIAAHAAKVITNTRYESIDKRCEGNQFKWSICQHHLLMIEKQATKTGQHVTVDIGAGTQFIPELQTFLRPRSESTVFVYAPPSEVLSRNPLGPGRSLTEYTLTEYTNRESLYAIVAASREDRLIDFIYRTRISAPGVSGPALRGAAIKARRLPVWDSEANLYLSSHSHHTAAPTGSPNI